MLERVFPFELPQEAFIGGATELQFATGRYAPLFLLRELTLVTTGSPQLKLNFVPVAEKTSVCCSRNFARTQ
jgi:hypothetical protein